MNTNAKHSQGGQTDTGLLFAAGLFFLTLALALAYVSFFGLAPLPKAENRANALNSEIPAAAVLSGADTEAMQPSVSSGRKADDFLSALSQFSVKEIFIGSYGVVDPKALEYLRDEVEQTFGVKTTILAPGAPIPQEMPFYDKTRKRYDSDVLLENVKRLSVQYGASVRFLYVVDESISSSSGESSSLWFRAEKGANAAIMSLSGLGTQPEMFTRAKKIALRAIGTSVGFDFSPSVSDISCIMHPVVSLNELDQQKDTLCRPEMDAVPSVFIKE